MSNNNIKIVKLDPTGSYLLKDGGEKSDGSVKSVYSEESSSSDEMTGGNLEKSDVTVQKLDVTLSPETQSHHLAGSNNEIDSQKTIPEIMELEKNENSSSTLLPTITSSPEITSNPQPTQTPQPITNEYIPTTEPINHLTGAPDYKEISDNHFHTNEMKGGDYNEENNDENTEVFDLSNEKAYDILSGVLVDDNNNNVADNLASINQKLSKHNEIIDKFVKDISYTLGEKLRPIQELNETLKLQNKIFERIAIAIETYVDAAVEDENNDEALAEEDVETIINNSKNKKEDTETEEINVSKFKNIAPKTEFKNRIPTPKSLKN